MLVLFDPLPAGDIYPRYSVPLGFLYWWYSGSKEGWKPCVPAGPPGSTEGQVGTEIHLAADVTQEGWEPEATKMVAEAIRRAPYEAKTVLVVVDNGGHGYYVGFLATSEVSPGDTEAEKIAQWVLAGVVTGSNSTYFSRNWERKPALTAWERILNED